MEWTTKNVFIIKSSFDSDLDCFELFDNLGDRRYLGAVVPSDIENMNAIVNALNLGACPIGEGWEDGNGNTCTLEGFNSL